MRTILLAVLATSVLSIDAPITTKGTVVVRSHKIYVAVAIAPTGGGQLERLFVFWPTGPVTNGVKRYENAMVEFRPGTLRITQQEQKTSQTYYVNEISPAFASPHTGFSNTSHVGKGLSHYVGGAASTIGISGDKTDSTLCYIDRVVCDRKIFEIGE